jgi:hypothetical protein
MKWKIQHQVNSSDDISGFIPEKIKNTPLVSDNSREPLQTGQPWHRQAILKVGQARDGGFHMIIGLLAGGLP